MHLSPDSTRVQGTMAKHLVGFPSTLAIVERDRSTVIGSKQTKPEVKDQAYYIELAIAKRKLKEAELRARNDTDLEYLLKLAEKKAGERKTETSAEKAQTNARADRDDTLIENAIKLAMSPTPARTENTELWELLNYSRIRLETGATPQFGKRGSCERSTLSGDDVMNISFKRKEAGDTDASPQDGDDTSDDSVDGSVSLESSTKNDEEESNNSDDDDDEVAESSVDDDEEGEGLPDYLKDRDDKDVDPAEARALYESATFKAASIISGTKDILTDVQMLQAIAIAEEAAKKGEDMFSTKRSLFKLNEAKIDNLKESLDYSSSPTSEEIETTKRQGYWTGSACGKIGHGIQRFQKTRE